jgi:lipopolysaccharide/colanic/teichoic acid biosynthesis glycosyltransferase/glycosyltransferase involved in cell wall biosynthesis
MQDCGGILPDDVKLVHIMTVPQSLFFLTRQVRFMKDRGFEVHAIASPGPALGRFGREEGIPTYSVEMPRRISPLGDLVALVRLVRILRRIRPTIVQSHTPKGGLLGMIAAFLAGVPVRIYTLHGLPLETARGLKRVLLRWTEKISCLLANQIIPVGPSLRRTGVAEGLAPAVKMKVLGKGTINGVDALGRFNPCLQAQSEGRAVRLAQGIPPDACVIGFVGRIVRDKGLEDLVQAWKSLREEHQDLHLLVVGAFEPQDPISKSSEDILRSDPRVHLTGNVDSMRPMYSAMQVLVLPTYREGFPTVPLEAAAMGLPVVATRVTGCVDAVLDGVTGTLVPAKDPDQLRDALRTYLDDPELGLERGRAGRERVLREFRQEVVWENFNREYRRLLDLKNGAGTGAAHRRRPQGSTPIVRQRPIPLLIKRLMDVAVSLLALTLASPVLGVAALMIRLSMGSPVFFRQRRPGQRGDPFWVLKLRTMRSGTLPDEQRLTKLGRLLRASSVDELPQLWNVLRGDMSLVGPRPLLMQYLGRYSPEQARRNEMKPGMTGWAQVHGRNTLNWEERFKLDLWYVDRWSLALDLWTLCLTVGKVLSRSDIAGTGEKEITEFMGSPKGDSIPSEQLVEIGSQA